jgi:hypothetical protein
VVPALIVLVIVGVWLTFNTLVRRSSPEKVIQGIDSGPSVARWQRAFELAQMLQDRRFDDFKRDPQHAGNVARILDREIDNADTETGMEDEQVTLRYYLARALGQFAVTDGLDVLVKAAETNRDARELLVRHGALEAIAERIYALEQLSPPQPLADKAVESALLRLSQDGEGQIRSDTAYALGKLGTPAAIERLEVLVGDPYSDARYNAAVALAHRGNVTSVETLIEMLDPTEMSGLQREKDNAGRKKKRDLIVGNALKGAEELARKNPDADFTTLIEALDGLANAGSKTLVDAQLPSRVRTDAQRIAGVLRKAGSGHNDAP